jgi:protein-L-isoaspartate O-methyltransferase
LAVFSRPVDWIISLDDSISNSAKENIYRDGKEIFLNRLKFSQVPNFATAQIPRAPNSLPYDLIVSSKAIDQYTSIPLSLKNSLVPRGIIIYPEEANAGSLNRRIKVDKIDEYGNLQTIKTAEL